MLSLNPYFDFYDASQRSLRGGNLLCAYGPLFFPILETVLPKLSPIHWEYVQSVRTEDGVDVLLAKKFSRQDMFSRRPLHSFTGCSHSSLCRTATKENGSVRETTIPVISHRLLLLLDYLMHKSPCWSTANYEKRVDEQIRAYFLQHCEEIHKASRQDLEGVILLSMLPLLV